MFAGDFSELLTSNPVYGSSRIIKDPLTGAAFQVMGLRFVFAAQDKFNAQACRIGIALFQVGHGNAGDFVVELLQVCSEFRFAHFARRSLQACIQFAAEARQVRL